MDFRHRIGKWLPYVAAIAIFYVLAAFYFAPQFSGRQLRMHDVTQYEGMSRDLKQYYDETGEDAQWTGNSFGGMPAYLIYFRQPALVIRDGAVWLWNRLLMGEPGSMIFVAMLGFWVMLLLWGVNPWIGIIPAIAYGFSTYTILIIGAGHLSKVWAIAYAPAMIGAVRYTLRGRYMLFGASLAALTAALEIGANHPQITYYFLLVAAGLWINELVAAYRDRAVRRFWKSTAALAGAAVLAAGANFSPLYYTFEHTGETTRGGSELATEASPAERRGLDLEYATAWSYGRTESFNMFIPGFTGGASDRGFSDDGEVARSLAPYNARRMAATLPGYWGDQPMTAGPTYLGAVMIFLAVMALFVLRGRDKWWLLVLSLLALLLAWGKNMMWFTELSFAVLPGYNKFRAVSTALVVMQWSVPLLAALLLSGMWRRGFERAALMRGLKWALGITGGIALFFALFGGSLFGFSSPVDSQLPDTVAAAMRSERASMLHTDSLRSLLFVALTAAAVWLYAAGRLRRSWLAPVLGILVCADMIPVDRRFLSEKEFVPASQAAVTPTAADLAILADTAPGYRVANFTVSPFNDAVTSYFHRSVGGYHGAKLRRYQDIIDRYLSGADMEAYNMLNTRYFIVPDEQGRPQAQVNEDANGAAWFVEELDTVGTPYEEIAAIGVVDTKRKAVADSRFGVEPFGAPAEGYSPADTIYLARYEPNYLRYEYSAASDRVAVFSEIYYDRGWKAYLDGEEAPYFRADYLLRAMRLPAGEHTVEFRFRAPHFAAVSGVTLAFSLLILAAFAVSGISVIRKDCRRNGQRQTA